MKRLMTVAAGLASGLIAMASLPAQAQIKVGDPVPSLTLPGSDGKEYNPADFKDKRAVVIAWYPKAFTGG